MSQPKALIEFKKITHAYFIAYCMANYGMSNTAGKLAAMEGMNPKGLFQVGQGGAKKKAIAEIPIKYALLGMVHDGPFSQIIAHAYIVFVYELWNGDYRTKIAYEIGCETNKIMCDVMGDLRLIRNWIVHDRAKADKKIKNLSVLKWPNTEGPFIAKSRELEEIQLAINTMQVYQRN